MYNIGKYEKFLNNNSELISKYTYNNQINSHLFYLDTIFQPDLLGFHFFKWCSIYNK